MDINKYIHAIIKLSQSPYQSYLSLKNNNKKERSKFNLHSLLFNNYHSSGTRYDLKNVIFQF